MDQDVQTQSRIEALQFYYERHSTDGIDGLEAKLRHAGRAEELSLAVRKKEMFYRLLVEFSHFPSAQQIFAYLLARIEQTFSCHLHPLATGLNRQQFDVLIEEKVLIPVIEEVGAGVFSMNAALVSGMVYWLGEQCYVRWHS